VTGGSKGIGRATVIELAALNARVITCSRNADELEELLSFCASKGWDVHGVVADVAQQEGRDKLVQTVRLSWGGQLDALINVRWNTIFHECSRLTTATKLLGSLIESLLCRMLEPMYANQRLDTLMMIFSS